MYIKHLVLAKYLGATAYNGARISLRAPGYPRRIVDCENATPYTNQAVVHAERYAAEVLGYARPTVTTVAGLDSSRDVLIVEEVPTEE